MAKPKKLGSNDINKNSSIQVSHSINKIKENEFKYTLILVIIFMFVFVIAGYVSLKVNNNYIVDNQNDNIIYKNSLLFSSKAVVLNDKSIKTDDEGLKSKGLLYTIRNNSDKKYKYRILLQEDSSVKEKCGCENNIDYNLIRYSIDGLQVNTLEENMIILDDEITGEKTVQNNIKIWVSNDSNLDESSHFHGRLVLEELR